MLEDAFHLLPTGVRDGLLNVCLSHSLFCNLYEALAACEDRTGLAPEEVWSEALRMAQRLGQSPRPDFSIKHDYARLVSRYRTFVAGGGVETHRSDAQAGATRCAVFTTLLYMLAATSSVDDNPYARLCVFIVRRLREEPLYQDLCRDIRRGESEEEADGHFVPPTDYTKCTAAVADTLIAVQEGEWMQVGELVQEAVGSHSPQVCTSVMHVLTGYNRKHGHRYQAHIDCLHEAIDRMVEEQNSSRIVENNGTINHIENNQGPVNGDVKEQRFLMGNGMSGKQIEAKCG